MLEREMHWRVVGNSDVVPSYEVIKTTECCEFHSVGEKMVINRTSLQKNCKVSPGRSYDDDERPRKGFSKNCGRVVEIELHVALCVSVVLHHLRHVLNVAPEVNDRLAGTLVFVVVRAADERRAEDDVVGATRVALNAVETDGAAIRNVWCVG